MKARVIVTLKRGVLDPQGKAIEGALASLGIPGVAGVRQGKVFDVELAEDGVADPQETLRAACERLLANTVIESYEIEGARVSAPPGPAEVPPPAPVPLEPAPVPPPVAALVAQAEEAPVEPASISPAEEAARDAEMPAEGHP